MRRARIPRLAPRVLAGCCAVAAVALSAVLVYLDARVSERIGLHRAVYPNVDFSGGTLVEGGSRGITLDFLADESLPQRFFSVRWRGFWYVAEAGEIELHGAGDDRLDIWLDGELVLRRSPPSDMHTQTRLLQLDAGVHDLRVEYQQHGGTHALHVRWAPRGGRPRPLPAHRLFRAWPTAHDIRLAQRTAQLELVVRVVWGALAVFGLAFLAERARRGGRRSSWWKKRLRRRVIAAEPAAEPLSRGGLLAVNTAYLTLSALFCSNVFLLTDLDSHGILGGDPAANNWQLQWVSRALLTDPLNLFNGNTFHPHPNVVALMDHMLTLAVINAPLSLLSDSPWFGYNLLIFLAYYLSCVGGHVFIREVTGSRQAAVWGGIFWAFLFYRFHHIGHLNILSFQWMPFIAAALIRFLRRPTRARTLVFAAYFAVQALVSWYHAVISAILVLVLSLLHAGRQRLTLEHAALSAAAVALCGAVILPLAGPYRRSLEETHLGNRYVQALVPGDRVSIADYLEPPRATLLGELRDAGPWIWGEQTLYVGYSALALALAGLFVRRAPSAVRAGNEPARVTSTRWIATGVCLVVVGFVLAKGFVSSQQVRLPLFYLSELPGLDLLKGLRTTQRYSLLLYFGILILSGAGAAAVAARCRSTRTAWAATALVCLAFIAEVYPYRLPFEPRPYEVSRLDRAVPRIWRDEGRTPIVLHLPIHYFLRAHATPEAVYMLDSTHHWARVVNGFSGGEPHGFRRTLQAFDALPEDRGVATLAELKIDLVAIHRTAPLNKRRSLTAFFEAVPWASVYRIGDERLVRIDQASLQTALARQRR